MTNESADGVDVPLRFEYRGGRLWVAVLSSVWGPVEFLAKGDEHKPDDADLEIIARFLQDAGDRVLALRGRIKWGFLYRPIRVAINQERRVGVQFQHRLFSGTRELILEPVKGRPQGESVRPNNRN